jgi:hypothetical protein
LRKMSISIPDFLKNNEETSLLGLKKDLEALERGTLRVPLSLCD